MSVAAIVPQKRLEDAKSRLGMAQYETRSWVGWHHHMTLSLLALWFVQREAVRLGGKNPGVDGAPTAGADGPLVTAEAAERAADR